MVEKSRRRLATGLRNGVVDIEIRSGAHSRMLLRVSLERAHCRRASQGTSTFLQSIGVLLILAMGPSFVLANRPDLAS
jgi:ABC-type taurine transport system ATPase subunit